MSRCFNISISQYLNISLSLKSQYWLTVTHRGRRKEVKSQNVELASLLKLIWAGDSYPWSRLLLFLDTISLPQSWNALWTTGTYTGMLRLETDSLFLAQNLHLFPKTILPLSGNMRTCYGLLRLLFHSFRAYICPCRPPATRANVTGCLCLTIPRIVHS